MARPEAPRPGAEALAPFERAMDLWRRGGNLAELWWSRHGGLPGTSLARHRLQRLVRHAREHSPFYGRLYAGLRPDPPLEALPIVTREALMARFDEWCTDRAVTRERVEAFVADPARVGTRFLGRYLAWTSSGTSASPGLFVQDEAALAVYDALVGAQLLEPAAGLAAMSRLPLGPARAALVAATGGHFASIASWRRMEAAIPGLETRSFSVLSPLPALVSGLDAFEPDFLACYPSVLSMLAGEKAAGRLRAAPALLWSGGETLTRAARRRIEAAFGVPLVNEYGASECLSIGSECAEGWMHVNDEWVILEGVDERGRAVPAGTTSHTVLLTNLANGLQPVIRYDLGDRLQARRGPCPCGDPRPAMRIEGRCGEPLRFASCAGASVEVSPLALETVAEAALGEHRYQLARTGAASLALRFHAHEPVPAALAERARSAIESFLESSGAARVKVRLDRHAPRPDARSGKLRAVVSEVHGG